MTRFKTISIIFILVIVLIFGCNIFYLVSLYRSIRAGVERDVMTALADADIDDMWERADIANRLATARRQPYDENGDSVVNDSFYVSGVTDNEGNFVTTTDQDGKKEVNKKPLRRDRSYTNQMVNEMSRQMHAAMDTYVDFNVAIMDSILIERLADRHIYPGFVAVDVVGPDGEIRRGNSHTPRDPSGYDMFSLCFNSDTGMQYRVFMTPLTRHILSEMAGVIVTIFLLILSFSLAFVYLFRSVSRLRTIEEMKDDFVSNMTHELKTPIAIAYSANDALLNYGAAVDHAKTESYLRIANKQLRRLGELVENILAKSMERRKAMQLHPEPIQLLPFLEEIAASQRMRGEKPVIISVTPSGGDVTVMADRTHLANVVGNLIDNAIKYSGESVRIAVNFDSRTLSVADNGIGIPSSSLPYIFNRFYRVPHGSRHDVRGYGIGLYYVRSILARMGWTVSVSSREGVGSVFTINFASDEQNPLC